MKIDAGNTNFNLRHLRAIHAIWAEGSFARAADRLGVVPSALTETVRQIEEIAGGALFDRRSRPPVPTPLGLDFLEDTAPLLDALDLSLTRLRARASGLHGALRLGAAPSAITPLIAPAVAAFRAEHPEVTLTLHDDVAETLAAMVADGRLDLAIAGRARSSPDLVQTEIASDPFGLACAADHPLARSAAPVQLTDIDPQQLIHLGTETGSSRLLAAHAALPEPLKSGPLRSHSTIAQLCLVRAGIGVALLPRNAVLLFNDPGIAFVPVADLALERKLYLLSPARRAASPVAQHFETLFRALAAQHPDQG
ncbi:LysR family transcriptional regulator [Salipiger bermudensis]|uniref:LysR family transcriptional regulator n=1 Tax=Salipiger bermudensis TaxID=344736 RepID=UPI001C99D80A|nr:LysR family transcriptional regulator [Salipiger bermudensis]MBY6006680.1 LysR family transcriptional regulator [Salipiger bermudensis]